MSDPEEVPVELVDAVFQECMRLTPDAPPELARLYAEKLVAAHAEAYEQLEAELLGDLDNWQPRGFLSWQPSGMLP